MSTLGPSHGLLLIVTIAGEFFPMHMSISVVWRRRRLPCYFRLNGATNCAR